MHSISMEYSIEYSRFPAILFIKSVYKLLPTSHVTFFFFLFETQCKYSLLLSVQITLRCSARVQVFLGEEKYALHFCSFRLQRCNLTFINVFPWRVSPRTRDSSRDTYVWRSAYLSSRSRRRYFTLQTQTRNTPIVVSSDSLPHSCGRQWYRRSFFQHDLPPPSPSLSSSSFLPRTSRSKEAKVEANHHAITAPGAANSDPFRERQQPPFAAPGHSLPLYRCIAKPTIFILDSAEKKASLSPPSTLFSASFLQITGGPTDRSRLLASGESIARMAPIPLWEPIDGHTDTQPTY